MPVLDPNPLEELEEVVDTLSAKYEFAALRIADAARQGVALQPPRGSTEAILLSRFNAIGATPSPRRLAAVPAAIAPALQAQRAARIAAIRTAAGERAGARLRRQVFQARATPYVAATRAPTGTVDSVVPPAPMQDATLAQTLDKVNARIEPAAVVAQGQPRFTRLHLDVIRLVCVDETNGFMGSEWGSDEIELGGSIVSPDGTVIRIARRSMGSYDDGTRRTFNPPKSMSVVRTDANATYPKSFLAILVLNERDWGGFADFLDSLVNKIKSDAVAAIQAWLAGHAGPLGPVLGLVVGWVVNKVVAKLSSIWGDDQFNPAQSLVTVSSPDGSFNGANSLPSEVVNFTGPGRYAMRFGWRVS